MASDDNENRLSMLKKFEIYEKKPKRDKVLEIAKIGISTIPVLGDPINAILDCFPTENQKKLNQFLEDAARELDAIQYNVAELQRKIEHNEFSDDFISFIQSLLMDTVWANDTRKEFLQSMIVKKIDQECSTGFDYDDYLDHLHSIFNQLSTIELLGFVDIYFTYRYQYLISRRGEAKLTHQFTKKPPVTIREIPDWKSIISERRFLTTEDILRFARYERKYETGCKHSMLPYIGGNEVIFDTRRNEMTMPYFHKNISSRLSSMGIIELQDPNEESSEKTEYFWIQYSITPLGIELLDLILNDALLNFNFGLDRLDDLW